MSELRDDLKGSRGSIDGFSNQLDECRRSVAQESRTLADMRDSSGVESHQLRAGCISSNRIVGEHDLPQRTSSAVEWPVSFHRNNAVRDNEVDRNGGAQIEDASLNALPVQCGARKSLVLLSPIMLVLIHARSLLGASTGS